MIFTVFSKNSRFQTLVRLSSKLRDLRQASRIVIIVVATTLINSQYNIALGANAVTKEKHIESFGKLLVQDPKGRVEPVNTLASDLIRKISKKDTWEGMSSLEFFFELSANPGKWKSIPLIKVSNKDLMQTLGARDGFVSFDMMFDRNGNYKLNELVQEAYNKKQTKRNKLDNEIINVDERVNICYQIFNGDFLKIFPVPNDSRKTWVTKSEVSETMSKENIEFVSNILPQYFSEVMDAMESGNWSVPEESLKRIVQFQRNYGSDIIPSASKIQMEILYNEWNLFGKLSKILGVLGLLLIAFHFVVLLKPNIRFQKYITISNVLVFIGFLLYSIGLGIRWYISGHAPWSNGYETMIYIGWATLLSGFVFAQRSPISLAVTTLLTSIILMVAGLSWMNPEITNLVPVLKSYWLIVHVAIITASYGFLAMGALLGILNLILIIVRARRSEKSIGFTIIEVSYIIEMALIIGLFMLIIGSFIGGVWANESWGRYWGWDPKETWALVTVLVYSIILHLRKIPGLKSIFALSSLAVIGLGSVIMTFFGVNYYLSGMHSYGQGDPPPIPIGLYISLFLIAVLIGWARIAERKNGKIIDQEDV